MKTKPDKNIMQSKIYIQVVAGFFPGGRVSIYSKIYLPFRKGSELPGKDPVNELQKQH